MKREIAEEALLLRQASLEKQRAKSEAWLKEFCHNSDSPSYNVLMRGLTGKPPERDANGFSEAEISNQGDYIQVNGQDAYGEIPDEFWTHIEVITGEPVPAHMRAKYFSCSC